MKDRVKKVMDFISFLAYSEIESDQYEEFLESIKSEIDRELAECNYFGFDDYDEEEW